MLRQVNIDGVLYKIGDSRFEGDNLAYIQLPESITVGTPLTDLAPIQKALDSTDGSLLYAPSLNVFFAPTASSTPATTRIWASTTGDKGYQLKATLNESGILSSAVVVEAPAADSGLVISAADWAQIRSEMEDDSNWDDTHTYLTTDKAKEIASKLGAEDASTYEFTGVDKFQIEHMGASSGVYIPVDYFYKGVTFSNGVAIIEFISSGSELDYDIDPPKQNKYKLGTVTDDAGDCSVLGLLVSNDDGNAFDISINDYRTLYNATRGLTTDPYVTTELAKSIAQALIDHFYKKDGQIHKWDTDHFTVSEGQGTPDGYHALSFYTLSNIDQPEDNPNLYLKFTTTAETFNGDIFVYKTVANGLGMRIDPKEEYFIIPLMDFAVAISTNFTPNTSSDTIALVEKIKNNSNKPIYVDSGLLGSNIVPLIKMPQPSSSGYKTAQGYNMEVYTIYDIDMKNEFIIFTTDGGGIVGASFILAGQALVIDDYATLYDATMSLTDTEDYVSTDLAKNYAAMLDCRQEASFAESIEGYVPYNTKYVINSTRDQGDYKIRTFILNNKITDNKIPITSVTDTRPVMNIEVYCAFTDGHPLGIKMVEPEKSEDFIIPIMDFTTYMAPNLFTPITTADAITFGKKIMEHANAPMYVDFDPIEKAVVPFVTKHSSARDSYPFVIYPDGYRYTEYAIGNVWNFRIFTNNSSEVVGVCLYPTNAMRFSDYIELYEDTQALTNTQPCITTDFAKNFGVLLNQVAMYNEGLRFENVTYDGWNYARFEAYSESSKMFNGTKYYISTYRYTGYFNVEDAPLCDIEVWYSNTEDIVGVKLVPKPDDCVKVSKEYMEVPTGHASHTCLEASISGTTLNITHKNESHISSVIHVPKSVLFTSDSAFELKLAPIGMMGLPATPYTPDAKIEISKDGLNWTQPTWDETNGISLKADTLNNELGKYSVFIRSDNYINEVDIASMPPVMKMSGFSEVSGSNIEVSGILDTMWGGKVPVGFDAISMFGGMANLVSAKDLVFPSVVAINMCTVMFNNCSSLTQAPILPATTLATGCYSNMFFRCTALTHAPAVLPATTLADNCYAQMFNGCTALTHAPILPAKTLAESCYGQMFNGCTALTHAPILPAETLAYGCYNQMFDGCTALTQAPVLPAMTLEDRCYEYMFEGCTSLTQAPVLPATVLKEGCYTSMFQGCTALTQTPELPATTMVHLCYQKMFQNCTSLTKPVNFPVINIPISTIGSMLTDMFNGCTGIKWATSGTPYIIRTADGAVAETAHLAGMFEGNGGTAIPETSGTPKLNTTYYLAE